MIVGIGIDILSIARFESIVLRRGASKIAKRICTEREYDEFQRLSLSMVKTSKNPLPRTASTSSDLPLPLSGSGSGPGSDSGSAVNDAQGDELFHKQVRYLSSRWALKEAAYKSLSPTLHALAASPPPAAAPAPAPIHTLHVPETNSPSESLGEPSESVTTTNVNPSTSTLAASLTLTWKDLDIIKHSSGALILRPTNLSYDRKYALLASLSHDAGVVVGVVIAQLKS
ncbi:hypothetical protein IAU59_007492 [Kwoniella sp. CBS 9459]